MDELTRLRIRNAELEAALARAQEEIAQQQAAMEALHLFDRELTRSEELDSVLEHVISWARKYTQTDYGIVARWDERRRVLEVLLANGSPSQQTYQAGDVLVLPATLMPTEAANKRSSDVVIDPNENRMVGEMRHADGRLIGVLVLQRHNPLEFSPTERKFMRSVVDRLAVAIHMASLLRHVQDLNRNRHQLFRMLSHDLRQPLTVLMGYIQLLEHAAANNNPEVFRSYLNYIAIGAQDLSDLLEEVLLMERVSDKTREEWETVSLRRLCQQALEKHDSQITLHQHHLEVTLPEDEALCKGLPIELKEAAGNLISNAIKYTPPGGRIRVSLTARNGRWYFEVVDNGYGIDQERQARLFESFYRAQQPGTENIKGTGLGLNLVKAIVEKHAGEVYFTSTVGEGSTFGFWIPALS